MPPKWMDPDPVGGASDLALRTFEVLIRDGEPADLRHVFHAVNRSIQPDKERRADGKEAEAVNAVRRFLAADRGTSPAAYEDWRAKLLADGGWAPSRQSIVRYLTSWPNARRAAEDGIDFSLTAVRMARTHRSVAARRRRLLDGVREWVEAEPGEPRSFPRYTRYARKANVERRAVGDVPLVTSRDIIVDGAGRPWRELVLHIEPGATFVGPPVGPRTTTRQRMQRDVSLAWECLGEPLSERRYKRLRDELCEVDGLPMLLSSAAIKRRLGLQWDEAIAALDALPLGAADVPQGRHRRFSERAVAVALAYVLEHTIRETGRPYITGGIAQRFGAARPDGMPSVAGLHSYPWFTNPGNKQQSLVEALERHPDLIPVGVDLDDLRRYVRTRRNHR